VLNDMERVCRYGFGRRQSWSVSSAMRDEKGELGGGDTFQSFVFQSECDPHRITQT
jgi:hypothetical protein